MEAAIVLYHAIKDICGGRVYSDHIPLDNKGEDKKAWPAIRYIQVGGEIVRDNCGYGFMPRIQVDIYANTQRERDSITAAVIAAVDEIEEFDVSPGTPPIHAWDFERQKYQSTLDFTFS